MIIEYNDTIKSFINIRYIKNYTPTYIILYIIIRQMDSCVLFYYSRAISLDATKC